MHRGMSEEGRFHIKYDKLETGCWEWNDDLRGSDKDRLYGRFWTSDKKCVGAHRYSWALVNGPIPEGGYICHKCDNPKCVNPDHLFLSDHHGNMADMRQKDRACRIRGSDKWSAKLTHEQVEEIRSIEGMSQSKIGTLYGVSQSTIGRLLRGVSHVGA